MKKLFTFFFAIALMVVSRSVSYAETNEYFVDDQAVEAALSAAAPVEATAMMDNALSVTAPQSKAVLAEKSEAGAFVLSWFLGWLGIHRAYLGTAGGVIVGYILTCGGLGIVNLIDWITLLIVLVEPDKTLEPYINNKKFFMWAN